MTQQIGQQSMGTPYTCLHLPVSRLNSYRQRVDEQPHYLVCAFAALHAPKQDGAKDYILASGNLTQYPRPGQMAETRRTDSQPPRMGAQASGQILVQRSARSFDPAAVTLYIE